MQHDGWDRQCFAIDNALHLKSSTEMNTVDKTQSSTLKKAFLNAPEVCKYKVISCFLPPEQAPVAAVIYQQCLC